MTAYKTETRLLRVALVVVIGILLGIFLIGFGGGCQPDAPYDHGHVTRDDGTEIPAPHWTNEPIPYISSGEEP